MKSATYKIKKPLKFFLLKLVVFFAIIFILDRSIGNILRHFYFKQKSGLQYRTTYSIETTKADLLIFGSSRANHHYQPDVFEKGLKLSYYNVGRDGNSIFYDYAILKSVLKRYSPKMIILDFKSGEFLKSQESYDRISFLLPYYKSHPEIHSIVELKSSFEKLKLLSSIYPYNSSIFTIAVGNAKFNRKRSDDIKGYVPLTKVWNGSIQTDSSSAKYEIDSAKVKMYESFIQDCITSKIELYIVCSPYFIKYYPSDYSVTLGQEIAKKHYLTFYDYSKDSTFTNNSKLFADVSHLNAEGATIFSNKLVDEINKTSKKTNIIFSDLPYK